MPTVRNCPRCNEKPVILTAGPFCNGCGKGFVKEYKACPKCGSDRTICRYTLHNDTGKHETHYCFACLVEFEVDLPRDEIPPLPPGTTPPGATSARLLRDWDEYDECAAQYGYDPWGAGGHHGRPRRSTVTYTYSRAMPQEGKCPKCQGKVTLRAKTGGYCTTCQKSVYPYITKVHPFSVMEEIDV